MHWQLLGSSAVQCRICWPGITNETNSVHSSNLNRAQLSSATASRTALAMNGASNHLAAKRAEDKPTKPRPPKPQHVSKKLQHTHAHTSTHMHTHSRTLIYCLCICIICKKYVNMQQVLLLPLLLLWQNTLQLSPHAGVAATMLLNFW